MTVQPIELTLTGGQKSTYLDILADKVCGRVLEEKLS